MPLRKIRAEIRQKFMIDVSLGQCMRAKQLALFDHEGGLIEHYGKLYQYRQALLDSNPGSTCRLDVDESSNGSATFKRIYICFKGVKDGWLLGCRRCAAFENEISKSFNRAILEPRYKPIIIMLEEIRLYIMQRLVAMNKIATNLEDTITPSIRKRLELLKEKQREWIVIPSGFQELEVRKDDQSYGVNLQHKGTPMGILAVTLMGILNGYTHDGGRGRGGSEDEAVGNEEQYRGRRGGDRGNRAVGSTRRGMAGSSSIGILTSEELDEEAYRECMEEQVREQAKNDVEQERLDKERREER
ncbi:hypothetical protein Tco_0915649, partial [Tanacetum coccineum]